MSERIVHLEPPPCWETRPTPATVLDALVDLDHTGAEPTLANVAAAMHVTKTTALDLLLALDAQGRVRCQARPGKTGIWLWNRVIEPC